MTESKLFREDDKELAILPPFPHIQHFGYALAGLWLLVAGFALGMIHVSLERLITDFWPLLVFSFLFVTLITLIFYMASNTLIVFDKVNKNVYARSRVRNKFLGRFSNIDSVAIGKDRSMPYSEVGFYRILFKDDIYGTGIRLSKTAKLNSSKLDDFKVEVLPRIRSILIPAHV